MAKPEKGQNRKDIFQKIDFKIDLINEQIRNHEKSIKKAKRMSGWQGPAGVSGIDYTKEPDGGVHISFAEGLRMIERDQEQIAKLKEERNELRRRRKRIKRIYDNLSGAEAEVYYTRVILGMTQEDAADESGFSRRHFQRVEAGMRDQGLL